MFGGILVVIIVIGKLGVKNVGILVVRMLGIINELV